MNTAFFIQTAASGVAIALLVALAAWAKIARPGSPLTDAYARALFAQEFPGRILDGVWIAGDGAGAVAKSGGLALVLCQVGDAYMARQLPWAQALAASFRDGRVRIDLADAGAPCATLVMPAWPPQGLEKVRGVRAA